MLIFFADIDIILRRVGKNCYRWLLTACIACAACAGGAGGAEQAAPRTAIVSKKIGVPVTLEGRSVDASIPIDHGHGPGWELVLRGIPDPPPVAAYAVFLNPPPSPRDDAKDNPHFAGNLAIVDHAPLEYVLQVAPSQVAALKAMAAWNDSTATVRFVPTREGKEPAVTVREVFLRGP